VEIITETTKILLFFGTYLIAATIGYWLLFVRGEKSSKYVLKIYMTEEGLNNVKHIASMMGTSDVDTVRRSMGLLQMAVDIQTEGGHITLHPKDAPEEILQDLVGMSDGEEWKR
jgi:hypothetical protein